MKLKNLFLALLLLSTKSLMAFEPNNLQVSLDEFEIKEEVARSMGLNAQQIEVTPQSIEYAKDSNSDGVGLKGRLFITWSVRDTLATSDSMKYTNSGATFNTTGTNLDGSAKGKISNSVKIGYQIFENLGIEGSYEKSNSVMEISSIGSGSTVGKALSSTGSNPLSVKNEFQTIKIGISTNANIVDSKSFRIDLVGNVNGGMISANSTYKSNGDVYKGAIGYTYGAEASLRMVHKSGLFVSTGVGINNKTIAPKTWSDGSHSEFNGSDKYVFISVGYSFGGKKKR